MRLTAYAEFRESSTVQEAEGLGGRMSLRRDAGSIVLASATAIHEAVLNIKIVHRYSGRSESFEWPDEQNVPQLTLCLSDDALAYLLLLDPSRSAVQDSCVCTLAVLLLVREIGTPVQLAFGHPQTPYQNQQVHSTPSSSKTALIQDNRVATAE
ncbi:hypothetical protein AOLI_G00013160 [Acnodon oligacanthus]